MSDEIIIEEACVAVVAFFSMEGV